MPRIPLIIGNWKMNGTVEETLKRITELRHKLGTPPVEVAIAPPFTTLYSAHVVLQETAIRLAAQNMYWENEGAFTGEISPLFLKEIGCSMVILGHSERRRYFNETDEAVGRKVQAALANELVPVLCIGETAGERKEGKTETVLEGQLKKSLQGTSMNDLKEVVIAYEPVWAIGTGKTATVQEIDQALRFIRDLIAKGYDAPTANGIRLLYGGSVTPEAAEEIFRLAEVDGFLIGGASLDIGKFLKIIGIKGNKEK